MVLTQKSIGSLNWRRQALAAVCLLALLFAALPAAQAHSSSFPILFFSQRGGNLQVYGMNVDGSNPTPIGDASLGDFTARYSPDGQKIVFVVSVPDPTSPVGYRYQLFVMNSDGSNQTRLPGNGSGNFYPIWSPDGSQILYSRINGLAGRNADIYVMNADGSNRIRLTNVPGTDIATDWLPTATAARVTDRLSLPQWAMTTAQAAAEPRYQQG